jgi:hypothetical protein
MSYCLWQYFANLETTAYRFLDLGLIDVPPHPIISESVDS